VSEAYVVEDDEQSTDGRRERDYEVGRLMAFSDGVFAVAITLLVFNVPVPAIAQNDAMSRLPDALLHTAPPLLTFALSFFLVGFYWIRHHQLFRQVVSADVWLLWLNLVVLFLVCLLPFSSGVVGRYHNTVSGAELYAVNLAAIAIAFSALYLYATRAHQVGPLPPGMGVGFFSQGLLLPVVVVAMVMALAPLNLVVAYVTGLTLMALVGIYTAAVPQTVSSAPIRGVDRGRLRFPRGAVMVTVRAGSALPELFWARFTGTKPRVRVAAQAVDIIESRGFRPVTWRLQSAQIALNDSIPWEFESISEATPMSQCYVQTGWPCVWSCTAALESCRWTGRASRRLTSSRSSRRASLGRQTAMTSRSPVAPISLCLLPSRRFAIDITPAAAGILDLTTSASRTARGGPGPACLTVESGDSSRELTSSPAGRARAQRGLEAS
jgi:uncharacterized membrane protein